MGTTVIEKPPPPLTERVPMRLRLLVVIVIIAVAASFAAQPFSAVAVAGAVILAGEMGRRIR